MSGQQPTSCPRCGETSYPGMFTAEGGVHWWECEPCDIRFIGNGPRDPYRVTIEERSTGRRTYR